MKKLKLDFEIFPSIYDIIMLILQPTQLFQRLTVAMQGSNMINEARNHLHSSSSIKERLVIRTDCETFSVPVAISICVEYIKVFFSDANYPLRNWDVYLISDIPTTLVERHYGLYLQIASLNNLK